KLSAYFDASFWAQTDRIPTLADSGQGHINVSRPLSFQLTKTLACGPRQFPLRACRLSSLDSCVLTHSLFFNRFAAIFRLRLSSHAAQHPASWCPPCRFRSHCGGDVDGELLSRIFGVH